MNSYHNKNHIFEAVHFAKDSIKELRFILNKDIEESILIATCMHGAYYPSLKFEINDDNIISNNETDIYLKRLNKTIAELLFLKLIKNSQLRLLIVEFIVATDISTYSKNTDLNLNIFVGKTIIRCADLNYLTKNIESYLEDINSLNRELNTIVSPRCQIEFIKNIALPQFIKLNNLCNTKKTKEWIGSVNDKINYWNIFMI
jgi:hypothetical protein